MSSSQKLDVSLSLSLPPTNDVLKPQERGVKLIHLLLTCANHAASGNLHHADECLCQISELSSISGDSMQRLAARFAAALAARLVKRWPGLYKALNNGGRVSFDIDYAKSVFFRVFPYLGFSYAIINRVLIQAMLGERVIHVINLDSSDPGLWVPFIRAVANGPDGPPSLKITCVGGSMEAQEMLGLKLMKEAESLNMPLEFNHVHVGLREVTLDMLKVQSGEALALVSILGLHVLLAEDDRVDVHFGLSKNKEVKECKPIKDFLKMVKSIGPKAFLLVHQESNLNSSRLVDRFVEGLHFYSALFDSIDVAFGGVSCSDRTILEEMIGKEIENIVAMEGMERTERHERYAKWAVRFSRAGFRPIRMWHETMEDAQKAVESYGPGGYRIISEKGSLMICWHDRPIYAVSAWTCFGC
ncbi:hypothetical protein CDL12_00032 [Handroanthus impetiginosus]|uniref:Uncharacterized protein n=1 Tax=Handroanthus impetiginosus TaxID=429701 RepID=A0A2G9IBS1_9LAMI|nr:hypothetical protein CDL12_00032 [Handroanthus impetiginosus]